MNKRIAFLILLLLVIAVGPIFAEHKPYTAATTSDPQIPVEDLELLLKPLRQHELVIEAEAWMDILQAKVHQISLSEVEMKKKRREISDKKDDIKDQIDKIKDEDKKKKNPDEQTNLAPDKENESAKADAQIQKKIENIEEESDKITEATEDIASTGVADITADQKDDMRSSEIDLLEKTDEVEQAREKLKEAATEVIQGNMQLEEKVETIGKAEIELHSKVKEQILANINRLREEQIALADRFKTVIDALMDKGGDITEYEQYITAISGIKLDIKDANATTALILGWLKSPEGGLRWAKSILSFIAIIFAFKILSLILGGITHKTVAMNEKFSDLLGHFFVNLVRKGVFVIGFIIGLSVFGVNIGPLVAGIGAIGFIVGFALQGTLGNFAAGIMILLHRPYDVGDVVKTAGITGFVQCMNLNTTTLKTFDNQVVMVPNGSIWGDNIINVTGSDTRRVDMVFGIGYSDDISKAQQVLEDIVKSHPLVLEDPEPNIKVHELADSSVNFVCRPWTKTENFWDVYWDITRSVKERFDTEGVSIPFPQRDIHVFHEKNE